MNGKNDTAGDRAGGWQRNKSISTRTWRHWLTSTTMMTPLWVWVTHMRILRYSSVITLYYCVTYDTIDVVLFLLHWHNHDGALLWQWCIARAHDYWPSLRLSASRCWQVIHQHQSSLARWYVGTLKVFSGDSVLKVIHEWLVVDPV